MADDYTFDGSSRTVTTADYELHYHEAGDGPTLVLLHGSGPGVSGWSNFKGNFPVFAKEFRTIILDMPGFGRSKGSERYDRLYPVVAAEALTQFVEATGIDRCHLLGNSMGGYVAATFALEHPDLTDKMVLMGPGGLAVNVFGPQGSEGAGRLREFSMNPSREAMIAWVDTMLGNKSLMTDELIDERMANALEPGAMARAGAVFATFMDPSIPPTVPLWSRASEITAPTLITWGRDDRMLPYEGALFAFRQMPNAELHVFSNCGHWAQVERKDEFERLTIEFLTR
jgi:4,5:9,10-diseco-3-hydroxy-5,9,17-trioxoandrosta-1(10),2-diene-4-oate hydrolase